MELLQRLSGSQIKNEIDEEQILMQCVQQAILYSAAQNVDVESKCIRKHHFTERTEVTLTLEDSVTQFQFTDYTPKIFASLRSLCGWDTGRYLVSLVGDKALRTMTSAGKSGAYFLASHDGNIIIKSLKVSDLKHLTKHMVHYYNHIAQHQSESLVNKIFGVHVIKRVSPTTNKQVTDMFVVQESIFHGQKGMDATYDLKGSYVGRTNLNADGTKIRGGPLKDLDLDVKLVMEEQWAQRVRNQIELDAQLMCTMNVMDYSLLLGIVYKTPTADNGATQDQPDAHTKPNDQTTPQQLSGGQGDGGAPQPVHTHPAAGGSGTQSIGRSYERGGARSLRRSFGGRIESDDGCGSEGSEASEGSERREGGGGSMLSMMMANMKRRKQEKQARRTSNLETFPSTIVECDELSLKSSSISSTDSDESHTHNKVAHVLGVSLSDTSINTILQQPAKQQEYLDSIQRQLVHMATFKSHIKDKITNITTDDIQERSRLYQLENVEEDAIHSDKPLGYGIPAHAVYQPRASPPQTPPPHDKQPVYLYFGIIDYLQDYNLTKSLERRLKSIYKVSEGVSVARPEFYRDRFVEFMNEQVFGSDESVYGGDQAV